MAKKVGNTYFFTGKGKSSGGGGGGDATDAIKYTEQTLTDAEQMQARKNQGLYYSEGTPAGVITWDGNTEGKESFNIESFQTLTLYKIADSPVYIPTDKIISALDANGEIIDMVWGEGSGVSGDELVSGKAVSGFAFDGNTTYAILILDSPQTTEPSPFDGLTGVYVTENVRTINYDAYEGEVHQIPAKYIPSTGLEYYEATITVDDVEDAINNDTEVTIANINLADILEAQESGKIVILNVVDAYDESIYRVRLIGGQEARDGINYGESVFVFSDYYLHISYGPSPYYTASYQKYELVLKNGEDGVMLTAKYISL